MLTCTRFSVLFLEYPWQRNLRQVNEKFSKSPKLYMEYIKPEIILKKYTCLYSIVNMALLLDTLPGRVVGTTIKVVGSSVAAGRGGVVDETLDPALHCSVWQQ